MKKKCYCNYQFLSMIKPIRFSTKSKILIAGILYRIITKFVGNEKKQYNAKRLSTRWMYRRGLNFHCTYLEASKDTS